LNAASGSKEMTMFGLLYWLGKKMRSKPRATAPKSKVSLGVENLDERLLMSTGAISHALVSGVNVNTGVTEYFAKNAYGQVREYDSAGGYHFVDSNVLSMDAGHDARGNVVLYEIKTDHNLYRVNADFSQNLVDTNVSQVAGSLKDDVFWDIKNGNVYEHITQLQVTPFGRIQRPETLTLPVTGATSLSAGTDLNNQDVVYVLTGNILGRYESPTNYNPVIGYYFLQVQGGVHGKWFADGIYLGTGDSYTVGGLATNHFTVGLDANGNSIEYGLNYGPTGNGTFGIYKQTPSGFSLFLAQDPNNQVSDFVGGGSNGFAEIFDGNLWVYTPSNGWVLRDGGY
jgi:hypothetical protein